jgi:ferredoxin
VKSQLVLHIDRIACDGRATCAELLPELIELDDWGYPIIADSPVPRDLERLAQAAVELCPKMALQLTASEGDSRSVSESTEELR